MKIDPVEGRGRREIDAQGSDRFARLGRHDGPVWRSADEEWPGGQQTQRTVIETVVARLHRTVFSESSKPYYPKE
jgi:hypothetical protein